MEEHYVSLELAKLLKENGFREICHRYYNAQHNMIRSVGDTFMMDFNDEEYMKSITMGGAISVPTMQMVLAWIRKKGYYIEIRRDNYTFNYFYYIFNDKGSLIAYSFVNYASYEEAAEESVKHFLTYLI